MDVQFVPELGYPIRQDVLGLIPEVVAPLVARRSALSGKDPVSQYRRNALKSLLVTCFGYMGFRKSKFGRIEAHEAIQAFARDILLRSAKVAEARGFSVVHGIVDSLWVARPNLRDADVDALCEAIHQETGLGVKNEGRYRWIVFLPSVQHPQAPVPARFYGAFADGTLKVRGLELRRRDTPPLIAQLQESILEELAPARTCEEFLVRMRDSLRLVHDALRRVLVSTIPPEELLFTVSLSKAEYETQVAQGVVARKLRRQGYQVEPGMAVTYLLADGKAPESRYLLAGEYRGNLDRAKYADLVCRAAESMFAPFGITRERRGEWLEETRQTTVWEAARRKTWEIQKISEDVAETFLYAETVH